MRENTIYRLSLLRSILVLLTVYPIRRVVYAAACGFCWLDERVAMFMYRNEVCLDAGFRAELRLLIQEITE